MEPLKVFDPHFHTWDLEKQNLPWLEGENIRLQRSFGAEQFLEEYRKQESLNLVGSLHIEADTSNPSEEDELVHALVEAHPEVSAFVTHQRLSAKMTINQFSSGVREVLHTPDSPRGRCLEPSFLDGLKKLAEEERSFDAVIRPDEIEDLAQSLEESPETTVVLDHMANLTELDEQSQHALTRIAELPNTFVKLSGAGLNESDSALRLLDFLGSVFGPERLMFASNWPLINIDSSVRKNIDILLNVFGRDNQIFTKTAMTAYRIERNSHD